MQSFYLYRLSYTGMTLWKYIRTDRLARLGAEAKVLTTSHWFPECQASIFSGEYGCIDSEFDLDSTVAPGLTRYGKTETGEVFFALQWDGEGYLLRIRGWPPVRICGQETVTFFRGGREIARAAPAPAVQITDEYTQAEQVMRLEIDPAYRPVLEMLASFPALRFVF